MIVAVRHAKPDDIDQIAPLMRDADRAEVMASHGLLPEPALRLSCRSSTWLRTGTVDGVPMCLFGVVPETVLSGIGCPWLLGTEKVSEIRRDFLRLNKELIPEMGKGYRILQNHVDERNTVSVRWLKWLGFAIMPAEPFGLFRLPFHRFVMEV